MGEFDDIIPEYVTESRELLETIEAGLLRLEQGGAQDETVHTVFRAIHSIKGGAGFVGLTKIERLAHKMEDVLNLIRNHDLEPSQPITDALLQSLDVLNSLFERIGEHDSIDVEGPMRALAAALDSGVDNGVRQQVQAKGAPHSQAGLPAFEVSEYTLKNKFKQGNMFLLTLEMGRMEQRGLTPIQLVNEMLSMGEILDSRLELPVGDAQTYEVDQIAFQVLYATVLEEDMLAAALHLDAEECRAVTAQDFDLGQPPAAQAPPRPMVQPAVPISPAPPAAVKAAEPVAARANAAAPPPSVAPAPPAPPALATAPMAVASEPPSRAGEYLTFSLGAESYGVDILQVQEIIGLPRLTRLPRAPEHMLGVMNLRGMVVPVLDMRLKLHLDCNDGGDAVVVVLRVGEKIMGAVVDSVRDVIQLDEDQIQNPPDFAGGLRRDYLRGLCHLEGEMVILLELDRLLALETLSNAA
jgi:chemotaxis signal transduction protein/HPt (histidine-containing phosphotransfer) domain-containing protein